jgi:uncharacterized protein (TIGR03067 family)
MFKTVTVLKCLAAALLVSGAIGGGLIAAFPDDPLDAEDRTVRVTQADPNSDKESIQGTWKIVEHWIHGRSVGNEPKPGGEVAADKVVIDDKTFRIRFSDGTEFVMPYTLDPSRTPAAIDVEFPEAEGPRPGIYELTGGKLRIRWSTTTKANPRRPTKFLAAGDPPNDEFTYLVLQRESRKTGDKAEEGPKVSPDQAAGTELEKLLQERQEVLKEVVDVALADFKMARIDYTNVLEAQRELIQAQLEQATTREQKIALYKQLVQNLEKVEEVADARRQAGEGSQLDRLKARAARLQAQIDLVRAQSSPED